MLRWIPWGVFRLAGAWLLISAISKCLDSAWVVSELRGWHLVPNEVFAYGVLMVACGVESSLGTGLLCARESLRSFALASIVLLTLFSALLLAELVVGGPAGACPCMGFQRDTSLTAALGRNGVVVVVLSLCLVTATSNRNNRDVRPVSE
ncbi:MAG: MauE/DoxX family redox-associated membrane protein [Phycisphaerales bacterium]